MEILVYEGMSAERGLIGELLIALVARVQGIGVSVVGVLAQQFQRWEERVAVGARKSRSLACVPCLVQDVGILTMEVQLAYVTLQQLRHRIDIKPFTRRSLLVVRQRMINVCRPRTEPFVARLNNNSKAINNIGRFLV